MRPLARDERRGSDAAAMSTTAAAVCDRAPSGGLDLSLFSSAGRALHSLAATVLDHLPPFSPSFHRRSGDPGPASHAAYISPGSSAALVVPLLLPPVPPCSSPATCYRSRSSEAASPSSAIRSFSSGVRIEGISSSKSGGGPAFVGQVFSMLDPSGNGLMAVTTRFDIPFLSKRTPEWIKKMLATIAWNDQKGPVFRFFMDLSDAVMYVKHLNVPAGMVGACRLDVAYEHFKEKPHMFQFVPNKKQVKAANDIIKRIRRKHGRRRVNGVPVFTAQNLNIAIATNDGIKWYTPYFFDKGLLDNILEASVDQHFHAMIQNRHMQRRQDVIDDNMTGEMFEEYNDSLIEPPEVQEALDEMGQFGIPLNVISKAAEIQLLDVVDKVLLGNKWLRKATGIQPKFPYLVDSFEERTASSLSKAASVGKNVVNTEDSDKEQPNLQLNASEVGSDRSLHGHDAWSSGHAYPQFPIADWFPNPWSRWNQVQENSDKLKPEARLDEEAVHQIPPNPLLPKITMVGISMGEGGRVTRANLKKTMEDLTKELEQANQQSIVIEDKDPLFIANVGDYSSMTRVTSS